MNHIDTEKISLPLREKAININERSVLITNFENSLQKEDLTEPANCRGFGRVRHFKSYTNGNWPTNPLPILPASKALKIESGNEIRAQVFQNAVCNWRCWYCFVDFKLLAGNRKYSDFLDCATMIDYYLEQENPPLVIDLTGGQPDLTPEWIPWMMEALIERGLSDKVYLWSDDNLSNDFFWQYLTEEQIRLISTYPMYGRVCCFKGIDEASFAHNTAAEPSWYPKQFELWEKLLKTGMDLYSYVTLPAESKTDFRGVIRNFLDKIQKVDEMYPLKMVPLEIFEFTPVVSRIHDLEKDLFLGQTMAIEVWKDEMSKRFTPELLALPITDIKTKYRS